MLRLCTAWLSAYGGLSIALPVLAGRFSHKALEFSNEVRRVIKTHLKADIRNGLRCLLQQPLGIGDAQIEQVFIGSDADLLFKSANKMEPGHMGDVEHRIDADFFGKML